MKIIVYTASAFLLLVALSCNPNKERQMGYTDESSRELYTCPMPQDSVFSDKPGTCPKCGMDLVKMVPTEQPLQAGEYTCPMHPEIIRNAPGLCPICGMDLVLKETDGEKSAIVELDALLEPTNEFVVSSIPVLTMQRREERIEIEALGYIAYDTRDVGTISARVSGRIENLDVRYRYQNIFKGQHILDIYSPELVTAQQNLIFLLLHDATNSTLIQAAKDKLLFLGMTSQQIQEVIHSGIPKITVAIHSPYTGHVHESVIETPMNTPSGTMKDNSILTTELALKEGMYVQKGQTIFTLYNPNRAWAILNIYGDNQGFVKVGDTVRIVPEASPNNEFKAKIEFIEPFFRNGNKTLTARIHFDNQVANIPVGSQVRATIFADTYEAGWLPKEAVLSLGMNKVVFLKTKSGFKAHKINTGFSYKNFIQIVSGVTSSDSVAINAQYLMDSESFIKTN